MSANSNGPKSNSLAVEIDNLAEDLLDAADAIERLTKKYSEDVQKILKLQAEQIKALAAEQGAGPGGGNSAEH